MYEPEQFPMYMISRHLQFEVDVCTVCVLDIQTLAHMFLVKPLSLKQENLLSKAQFKICHTLHIGLEWLTMVQ